MVGSGFLGMSVSMRVLRLEIKRAAQVRLYDWVTRSSRRSTSAWLAKARHRGSLPVSVPFRAIGMTNVGCLVAPETIFSDIHSVISDALEGASNENKVYVVWHKLGVHGCLPNNLFDEVTRHGVQL